MIVCCEQYLKLKIKNDSHLNKDNVVTEIKMSQEHVYDLPPKKSFIELNTLGNATHVQVGSSQVLHDFLSLGIICVTILLLLLFVLLMISEIGDQLFYLCIFGGLVSGLWGPMGKCLGMAGLTLDSFLCCTFY